MAVQYMYLSSAQNNNQEPYSGEAPLFNQTSL